MVVNPLPTRMEVALKEWCVSSSGADEFPDNVIFKDSMSSSAGSMNAIVYDCDGDATVTVSITVNIRGSYENSIHHVSSLAAAIDLIADNGGAGSVQFKYAICNASGNERWGHYDPIPYSQIVVAQLASNEKTKKYITMGIKQWQFEHP